MVTVLVGPTKHKFNVHQDFLTYHSAYFASCLEGDFIEAVNKVVELDDTTVGAFAIFMRWIYTEKAAASNSNEEATERTKEEKIEDRMTRFQDLVDAWVLADDLVVPQLQNGIMKCLKVEMTAIRIDEAPITRALFVDIYNKTSTGSPLRMFWVYQVLNHNSEWLAELRSSRRCSQEMFHDLYFRSPKPSNGYYVDVEPKQQRSNDLQEIQG